MLTMRRNTSQRNVKGDNGEIMERMDARTRITPADVQAELMNVLTLASLMSLGMLAQVSLVSREDMTDMDLMDKARGYLAAFIKDLFLMSTWVSLICSYAAFVLALVILLLFNFFEIHVDDRLAATEFKRQYRTEFAMNYVALFISLIAGSVSGYCSFTAIVPMSDCAQRMLNDGLVDIAEAVRTDVPASEIWGDCDPNDVYGIAVVGTGLAFFAAVWVGVGWYIREAHRFHVRFYREHRARYYDGLLDKAAVVDGK